MMLKAESRQLTAERHAVIVALVGPTGSGKTALALPLAERWRAEIVNADSRQVYRGLDVGSAKPTRAERERVPHHLFDVVDPDEPFDCARYRQLARGAIDEIRARGRTVLLVGGTGLYLKVLRYGLVPAPPRDPERRAALAALERRSPGSLHARLASIDAPAARRLHRHDVVRLSRALEVYELTGRTLSEWQRSHGFRTVEVPVRMVGLRLDRAALYERIDRRCRAMVEGGLIDEVQELWRRGYGAELAPLRSIGYREVGAYLKGKCDLERAIGDMARATRRLAKRQLTWLRRDATIDWIDAAGADPEQLAARLSSRLAAADAPDRTRAD
jgi:tRNA dimethylallyltransferase